jgi:hypothetical protein
MIALKIQCGCGQRYAFDVEPIAGRLPAPVACPTCGTDGTYVANTMLAERIPAAAAAPVATATRISVVTSGSGLMQVAEAAPAAVAVPSVRVGSNGVAASTPSHVAPARARLPGQLDPDKALIEARSKIMWGDDAADVAKFLMSQGFTADDAKAALAPIVTERAQTVRKAGTSKIFGGIGMMMVPVIAFFTFMSVGYFPIKIFGATVAVGLWGAYRVLTGTIMFLSPKSEKGDVSEM